MQANSFNRAADVRSINDALQSHVEWKVRLRSAIRAREPLDVDAIRLDSVCKMGIWLYGEGERWGKLAAHLRETHAEFHAAAAGVAEACNAGNFELAEQMMGPGSAYMKATTAVRTAIFDLVARSRHEQPQQKLA
jgi:methyl-accepting chemotaxis protein